jgi:hypothetical protein
MNQSTVLEKVIISGIDISARDLANLGEKVIDCSNSLMGLCFDISFFKNARRLGAADQTKAPIELTLNVGLHFVKSQEPKRFSNFC